MLADVVLTVSQSKRLIAKGVAAHPAVRRARQKGWLIIATGTTNGYIVEEVLGGPFDRYAYVTGHVVPPGFDSGTRLASQNIPDVILHDGERVTGMDRFQAARRLGPGDVFIKGANALNYEKKIAGVTIGDINGGTAGGIMGPIIGRRATLIIPIGLEKLVAHDILETARLLGQGEGTANRVHPLFPITGEIITEIEAFHLLHGVQARHVGSGGIFGAEGAVRLLLQGTSEQVEAALQLVEELHKEPPF
ncbi:MAG: hypothetical protein J7M34_01330 [Anaerolineae bacterium]|nr:hypothetical protein [Anaerolineae bacterium]